MFKKLFFISLSLMFLFACSNNVQKEPENESTQEKNVSTSMPKQENKAVKKSLYVKGKIVKSKDVAEYTYLLLDDGEGNQIWAAIPKTKIEVGKIVVLKNGFIMRDFESKTLKKTFKEIIFASGIADENEMLNQEQPMVEPGTGGSKASQAPFVGVKVTKADKPNSYTVEEIFLKANELNNKRVVIKGKAVKVLNNIMGKNWIHIQDGTGTQEKSNYDLVVTTTENIEPDSVVILEGILATNKDFGYGYKYNVIIEKAKFSK